MATIQERLTLEAFLELPEEEPALEYEYGEVTQKVPPQFHHARLQLTLASLMEQASQGDRRTMAFTELRTTFGGFSRVPDVAVYRWERIPRDPSGEIADGQSTEPPDIAVEIVSPDQSATAQLRCCLEYVAAGVAIALLVDPHDRSVVIVRPNDRVRVVRGEERIDLDDVLPGFQLTVQQLFDSLRLS
ncbi:MAG: hypothetical protein QOF51_1536 [Chloroflexota bacterium]|nr:hypothetical protein [Chloroflexota bacterium]